jgi:hypothetical protein
MCSSVLVRFFLAAFSLFVLHSCSSIKIQTGETPEEKNESTQEQARQFKIRWSADFERATELKKVELLLAHLQRMENWYQQLGDTLANRWREGNTGRGEPIPADEIRKLVDNSLQPHQPMLTAWDEMIEYGVKRIGELKYFAPDVIDRIDAIVDQFYKFSSVIRYPSGEYADYDQKMRMESQNFDAQLTDLQNWLKSQ